MPKPAVSTPNFADAVKNFEDAGVEWYNFVPVAPPGAPISKASTSLKPQVLGKAPGHYNAKFDTWSGLRGKLLREGATEAERDEFDKWPTGNVGILGRAYPGIDSDVHNEDARRLVEKAFAEAIGLDRCAIRLRGDGPRRLYALRARWDDPVNTRHVSFSLPNDNPALEPHKIDVIGLGAQYLITGTHPSGDLYRWDPDADLADAAVHDTLAEIVNDDIARFFEALTDLVKAAGGTFGKVTGNTGDATERKVAEIEPTLPDDVIFAGLDKLANTEENFGTRDELVGFLTRIRAAAGKRSLDSEFEDRVREWATADEAWCDEAYFDKIWKSTRTVRVSDDALAQKFAQCGIGNIVAAHTFDDGQGERLSSSVNRAKDSASKARSKVLQLIAGNYVFRATNLIENHAQITMRNRWNPTTEWPALSWYLGKTVHRDTEIGDLHREYGPKEEGFYAFVQDLWAEYRTSSDLDKNCWFDGEILDPTRDFGEIVVERHADKNGIVDMRINRWHKSAIIREAMRNGGRDPNPAKSEYYVRVVKGLVKAIFGDLADYEFDTLAYMAQTGKRPGSMLFLVGEPGVGKSTYTNILTWIFNGRLQEQMGAVEGAKMTNEQSRRFALADVEGCRIITIKEMPEGKGTNVNVLKQVTADLKRMVDPGAEGDYFAIEKKGKDVRQVKNHSRVLMSSNHNDAIEIEANDRRIFMVDSEITIENKPDAEWYAELNDVIGTETKDNSGLAAFFRWLLARDISHYSRNRPPPVSPAKQQSIVARLKDPTARHARAALEWLRANKREIFTVNELSDLMTRCATAEAKTTGDDDLIFDYRKLTDRNSTKMDRLRMANTMRQVSSVVRPLKERKIKNRDGSWDRLPTSYVYRGDDRRFVELEEMRAIDFERLLREEVDYGTPHEHPWETYREEAPKRRRDDD